MNGHTIVIDRPCELPDPVLEHLERRYGPDAGEVAAIAAADARLATRIVPCLPDILAEAAFAARRGRADTVAGVLLRQTRVGFLACRATCEAGGAVARRVAIAMAPELGWSSERTFREADAWRAHACA
jgi:glycerol-3-phosphate dehydrogenase